MLIDSHCHLDYLQRDGDLDEVLSRARAAGVSPMLTISTKLREFDLVRSIAEAHADVFCSVGVHPHEAESEPETTTDQLVALAAHPKAVGIGETGLDFFYEHSPRDVQETVFRAHIAAARETGLPVIVHTRDAEEETIRILRNEMGKGAFPGLIHCFSGTQFLADAVLELGLYISISGIVTFKKADDLREVVATVPIDRILVETDSPYLAPVPHRGKRNEPAFSAHTARRVADLLGLEIAELEAATTDNFRRLFSKAEF
ncbi:TatD family hydrolase [Minwuia sp.]|uniref:TatD family hydrolase n=1 Tax=Minwuia sp. TaxID=2493630 RepID=UPI003A8C8AAC